MTNKLVKGSVDIETAEAFTRAIGDAIEKNDVEAAQILSGELRSKVEGVVCACGHGRRWHSMKSNAELPNGGTGTCLATIFETDSEKMRQCRCVGYTPAGDTALANVSRAPMPKYFPEGKHFARLRKIDVQKSRRGQMVVFELNVVASATLPVGGTEPMYYYMPIETNAQTTLAAIQFQRLGIDPTTIVMTLNLDVVVIVVERARRTGGTFMSINLRLPDETDG